METSSVEGCDVVHHPVKATKRRYVRLRSRGELGGDLTVFTFGVPALLRLTSQASRVISALGAIGVARCNSPSQAVIMASGQDAAFVLREGRTIDDFIALENRSDPLAGRRNCGWPPPAPATRLAKSEWQRSAPTPRAKNTTGAAID